MSTALGVDPGIHRIGWGLVVEKGSSLRPVKYGCLVTDPSLTTLERLGAIYSGLSAILEEYRPDKMVVEDLYFNQNAKTAMIVGQARGVIMLSAHQYQCPVLEMTPLQIKLAITGYGRASKKQMQQMVKTLLNLKEIPKPDDTADGLAAAICAFSVNQSLLAL